jgi:hypothetical protein
MCVRRLASAVIWVAVMMSDNGCIFGRYREFVVRANGSGGDRPESPYPPRALAVTTSGPARDLLSLILAVAETIFSGTTGITVGTRRGQVRGRRCFAGNKQPLRVVRFSVSVSFIRLAPSSGRGGYRPFVYMYVSNAPEKSYWEAEWMFPPVGYQVSIALDGDKCGPAREVRAFYLSRVGCFERTIALVRPRLDAVFRQWLGRSLAEDLWADVKLAGFWVEDPEATAVSWDVSFETFGGRWLSITIPMIGDVAQEAIVDT